MRGGNRELRCLYFSLGRAQARRFYLPCISRHPGSRALPWPSPPPWPSPSPHASPPRYTAPRESLGLLSASGLASRGRRARISVQCDYLCELQCSDTRPTRPGERHTHLTHSRYTSLGSTPPSGAGSWCKWPTSWRDRRVSFRRGSSDAPAWTCRRSCRSGTGPSRSRRWTRVVAWRAACPCVATPSAAAAARCRPAADAHTRVSGGRAVGRGMGW